jgi:hypothetical protein
LRKKAGNVFVSVAGHNNDLVNLEGKNRMSRATSVHKLTTAIAFAVFGIDTATANTPYFAVFGVEKQSASVSDSTFDNYSLAVQAGRWLTPGIALQAGAIVPATDDTVGSVNFSLDGLYTAGIRLEGPMEAHFGTSAFVVGGFASAKIDATSTFAQTSDWYHGYFATAGFLVGISKRSQLSLTYSYHAVDPAVTIPAVQLGYRFQF